MLSGVSNAMESGAPAIVCPTGHEITDVDDEGTGDGSDFLPGVVGALDLETAGIVLGPQDGEGAVVAVCASTKLVGLGCVILRRVIECAQCADGCGDVFIKEVWFELQCCGEESHDARGEILHGVVIVVP